MAKEGAVATWTLLFTDRIIGSGKGFVALVGFFPLFVALTLLVLIWSREYRAGRGR